MNRLKQVLPSIVSVDQYIFLSGRKIQDNLLLAHELVTGYNRRGGARRCALKVDFKGAYDSRNWRGLLLLLQRYGFPKNMIEWIMMCVTSAKYFIIFNGKVKCYFEGKKGLRQGGPMSPIFFTLVMEIFASMLSMGMRQRVFLPHTKCKKVEVTHIAFVDVVLVFFKGEVESLKGVLSILK